MTPQDEIRNDSRTAPGSSAHANANQAQEEAMSKALHHEHRPPGWPDYDEDFRTHDDAISFWLMTLALPLALVATILALVWVL